ncbi:sulfatase [Agaribacter flavus]|uniref:Sulfatase-like hydrolase/transferase n=1 Tax=Agaribacter flavus TaxID=1902781 RepID=A0ABV7FXU7_9ALTE
MKHKKIMKSIACILLIAKCAIGFAEIKHEMPNIVFMLADDLGWNDTSLYNENRFYETPNIQRLAEIGVKFTRSYTNSPLCSPTRASILTGQTPARHGSTEPAHGSETVRLTPSVNRTAASFRKSVKPLTVTRLNTNIPTLSRLLKERDYQTAHFGKWHLGAEPYSPLEHGFDVDIPHYEGSGPSGGYLAPWRFAPNLAMKEKGEHIDIRLAKEASDWIKSVHNDGPFYLNFWTFSVHSPFNAQAELVREFEKKQTSVNSQQSAVYAAMVKHFDDSIGILLDTLEKENLLDSTIIVFTSDNGGNHYGKVDGLRPTSNLPLSYGKASNYEGGIRVPTVIYWPNLHNQPHTVDTPIQSVDFFPTLLNGLAISWPSSHVIDGRDIRPLIAGDILDESPVFTYFPAEPSVPGWLPPSASVILNGWKLIKTFHYGQPSGDLFHLFDLNTDFGEMTNLADVLPDKVQELDRLIEQHLIDSFAVLPRQNENYIEGSFDYTQIGLPSEQFSLVSERKVSSLSLSKYSSTATSNEDVYINLHSGNASDLSHIHFEQFLGPEITMEQTSFDTLKFTAPEVYVETYIGIAISSDSDMNPVRHYTKISPVEIAPTIQVLPETQEIAKGDTLVLQVDAQDLNQELLKLSVSASLRNLDLKEAPLRGTYSIPIPSDTSASELSLTFSVSDGNQDASTSVTVAIKEPCSGGTMAPQYIVLFLFWIMALVSFREITRRQMCR